MGGIMSVTGWPDGPPTRTGTAIADDIWQGLCACIGILSVSLPSAAADRGRR
jgi:crotonobetainyl-CoA:carnitine CoA-transferase CaiB-like acyl-CoA transferase